MTKDNKKKTEKQCDIHVVVKSFYCNNEHNFIERCGNMCEICKKLQD